jgi:MYXO-CTERM domain-containing protein
VVARTSPPVAVAAAAMAVLTLAVAAGEARAAVALSAYAQESAHNAAQFTVTTLSVTGAADRLLVVAVATGDPAVGATSVTWGGTALIRATTFASSSGRDACRAELWTLVAPAGGNQPLDVRVSATTAFGVGAVVYTGVDQTTPMGALVASQGADSDVSVGGAMAGDPFFAAACLGGAWNGPNGSAPAATSPVPGQDVLWDFTEPGVVGLGMDRLGGPAAIRWTVAANGSSYTWAAAGFVVQAVAMPDAAPPSDGQTPDGMAPFDGLTPPDAARPDAAADAPDPPDAALPADGGPPPDSLSPPDAGPDRPVAMDRAAAPRTVDLRVGCACGVGQDRPGALWLVVLAGVLLGRRFRPPAVRR